MKTEFIKIDKKLADSLLLKNNKNRRANVTRVAQYAKEMKEGGWFEASGETIKICQSGEILDGQHRLLAISKANVSLNFLVCFDVKKEAMPFIDTGKPRNAADIFHIEKITNGNIIPSIIRLYYTISKGLINTNSSNVCITNSQTLDIYYNKRKFWDEASRKTLIWYSKFAKILTPSTIGGFYSVFFHIDSEQAEEFFNQLCGGESITNLSIVALRNRLIQEKTSLKKARTSHNYALIIKTWNAFRTGVVIKSLKFNPENEEFPKPL
jgi:hypothetical protein